MLSRTAPDIRDLLVALAAVGLAPNAGRTDHAEGAALLHAAKLVAIVRS